LAQLLARATFSKENMTELAAKSPQITAIRLVNVDLILGVSMLFIVLVLGLNLHRDEAGTARRVACAWEAAN
jgi:hypothetical protein